MLGKQGMRRVSVGQCTNTYTIAAHIYLCNFTCGEQFQAQLAFKNTLSVGCVNGADGCYQSHLAYLS